MDEYKKQLQEQYDWYKNAIDKIGNEEWHAVPTDSFHLKLATGKIKEKRDDIEWLEYAIPKLQTVLGKMEAHIEREKYKRLIGNDQMSKLKKI